jgi:hypothetical protein
MLDTLENFIAQAANFYSIPISEEYVKGHRDHSGASTSCPGSTVHQQLSQIRVNASIIEGGLSTGRLGRVRGFIWDRSITDDVTQHADLGASVAGARILFSNGVESTTNANGYFDMQVPEGVYYISAAALGYRSHVGVIQVVSDEEQWSSIGLRPLDNPNLPAQIQIYVYNLDEGFVSPVVNAHVLLTESSNTLQPISLYTDDEGNSARSIQAGVWTFQVSAPKFEESSRTLVINGGRTTTLEIGLAPALIGLNISQPPLSGRPQRLYLSQENVPQSNGCAQVPSLHFSLLALLVLIFHIQSKRRRQKK